MTHQRTGPDTSCVETHPAEGLQWFQKAVSTITTQYLSSVIFAVRGQGVGGEYVGGGCSKLELDEGAAGVGGFVRADGQTDGSSAAADGDVVVGFLIQGGDVGQVPDGEDFVFDRVQRVAAASHAAGVPSSLDRLC